MSVPRFRNVAPGAALVLALLAPAVVIPQSAQAADAPPVTAAAPIGHVEDSFVPDADATSIIAVDPVTHRAFVQEHPAYQPTSQVAVWDGDTMRRLGTVPGMQNLTDLSSLVVDVAGRRLVGVTDTAVVATDLATGSVVWKVASPPVGWLPTLRVDAPRGRLVIAGESGVAVVDAATGNVRWTTAPGGRADVDTTSGAVYVATPWPRQRPGGTVRRYDADGTLVTSSGVTSVVDNQIGGIAVDGARNRVYTGSQVFDLGLSQVGTAPTWPRPVRWIDPQFVDPASGTVWFRTDTSMSFGLTPWTPGNPTIALQDVVNDGSEANWDPGRDRFIARAVRAPFDDSMAHRVGLARNQPPTLTGTADDVLAAGVPAMEPALGGLRPGPWSAYTVTAGALPTGMRLDPVSGVVSGTPTTPGTFRYAVTLTISPSLAASAVFVRHVVAVDRVAGPDRFSTTALSSAQAFPGGADVAYIASGRVYPDALSAAPAAVIEGGPVLLSEARTLPTATRTELLRLNPRRVVVVGGSVEQPVVDQLRAALPRATVTHVGGATRYDVSRAVVTQQFPQGADTLYVATGAKFPDALVAGAAAGSSHAPLLLVPGDAPTADAATLATVRGLHPRRIVVAGGSVSAGIITALRTIATVDQLTGPDRYQAAVAVNLDRYPTAGHAFLVNGEDFPDALSASPLAGTIAEPLYLASPTCVPATVLQALGKQGVDHVTIIGGKLGAGAAALRRC
ncbi:cell wall-binding repeat-containing protein [Curtobacterium albidum]|uniref:cell wall-binding repeat-containing protein n=1 Tax=Curtobacterium citreum TaxID=2036 RepID=UPI0020264905|nr:cell wall-binding repeat-containing protein [Curtobacterium albidum]MCL9665754.1 cell wall-binding repeat-containing protein [Curtobacterium albidum]